MVTILEYEGGGRDMTDDSVNIIICMYRWLRVHYYFIFVIIDYKYNIEIYNY